MEDEPGLRSTNIPETVRKSSVPAGMGGTGPVARELRGREGVLHGCVTVAGAF
jgi:hypothetical protein